MDKKTIYSKTGKGVLEIKNKSGKLSKDLVKVLILIDGKSSVGNLISESRLSEPDMDRALANLTTSGYIKEFSNTAAGVRDEPSESSYVDDLDFTASLSQSKNVYQSAQTEWRQRESTDRAKAEQEANKKREDEDRLKKERELKQAKEEVVKLGKVEAERKSREAAALKQREELERKSRIEADLMSQTQRDLGKILEAERKALEQSERKKQEDMSAQAKQDAERRSLEDAERRRKEEDERKRLEEEQKRRDEEARKRKEEEERKRKEEEERKRRDEDERRRREEEERKGREEGERKRREEEERKRREEEERKRKEEEERKRREEEERKRKEEEERKRKEEEERRRREEEERRRREEEERRRQEEEERKHREEEERKRKEEEERKRKAEEARKQREEDERLKRRQEEDRRRQEEDERRRIEDEEHRRQAKIPGEDDHESLRRKDEDDARRRREEEEVRRRDEDGRRERDETDRRRRGEEERVSAAARSDLPSLDFFGLTAGETRVASEFEQQQDTLRKREEEEERRREAADQERRALQRAEREEDARLEAERREAEDRERRERMEREREEREDRERKRQEEKENRIREQEERRLKADHVRSREAEMKVESERRKREEDLGRRRKEQEDRDRKRVQVDTLKKQKAIRGPLDRFKPVIIGLVVLVAIAFGGIQLMPMNAYIPAVEKLASDHIKEPVTIGAIRLSILGGFQMNLENVKIGLTEDVKAGSVTLSMGLGSVFAENKVIEVIEADSITVAEEVLSRLPKWKQAAAIDPKLQIDRLRLNDIKIESRTLQLPALNLDLSLVADGAGRASVSTADGRLRVELTPRGSEVDIAVAADQGWVPAIGPAIPFTDLTAKAVASGNEIRVDEFNALFYGGAAKGSARIRWGGPWTLEGDVGIERAALQELMSVFTKDAKSSGQLQATLRYAMSSSGLATLFDAPRVDGTFAVRKGDLDGVDLVRALQVRGRDNVQGGATRFEEISGTVGVANNRYQYLNLRLSAGVLSATGGVDIAPDKDVSGRIAVELLSQSAQVRGNFTVTGNLKAIVLRPN